VEQVERRSRFIATLGPAPDPERAQGFIRVVEAEFPDATHHCWAFVAGPPGTTAHVGMSDAGEPHGTAGRPILNVLLHSGVGEIVAVVTRYFGGVKLGKGGLGRAYGGAVRAALESLPTDRRVARVRVRVQVPFAATDALFRLLEEVDARGREQRYGTGVKIRTRVSLAALARLRREVAEFTSGEGLVEVEE
jgi:uncharacterized YigZ family protein